MIVGNIYKKCDSCGKSKTLEAFELDIVEGDEEDPYIKNHTCNDCYQLQMTEFKDSEDERKGMVWLAPKKPETYPHARMCPKCTSKTGCGCDDTDSDGYK